jgi:hypothetical protein
VKRRILALSRDRGSMQAIAPVIIALEDCRAVEVKTYATKESFPVIAESGLTGELLDAASLSCNPKAYLGAILDTYGPALVLTGSSPARGRVPETPEQFAILEARRRGLRTIAVLDYWGMYEERFSRDGQAIALDLLPDKLCVIDRRAALDLAALGVPANTIAITQNPWLDTLAARTAVVVAGGAGCITDGITVLLISQPLAETRTARKWQYDQYDLFRCLLDAIPVPTKKDNYATLRVLPHPSEDASLWQMLIATAQREHLRFEVCNGRDLNLLRDADYVVTSHSTLAYEALYFGTPCISLRPGTQNTMRLWIEDAGLSRIFTDPKSLQQYLLTSVPMKERARILTRKQELVASNLFFSDGHATERVLAEVIGLLDSPVCPSTQ